MLCNLFRHPKSSQQFFPVALLFNIYSLWRIDHCQRDYAAPAARASVTYSSALSQLPGSSVPGRVYDDRHDFGSFNDWDRHNQTSRHPGTQERQYFLTQCPVRVPKSPQASALSCITTGLFHMLLLRVYVRLFPVCFILWVLSIMVLSIPQPMMSLRH